MIGTCVGERMTTPGVATATSRHSLPGLPTAAFGRMLSVLVEHPEGA
jgi:hypothetical protein